MRSTLATLAFAFMVVGTVFSGLLLLPLCWTIPMTVHYYKNKGNVGIGFKVCTLIFTSLIGGILALCDFD